MRHPQLRLALLVFLVVLLASCENTLPPDLPPGAVGESCVDEPTSDFGTGTSVGGSVTGDLHELGVHVSVSSASDDETGMLAFAGGEGLDQLCFRPADSSRAGEEVTAQLRVQATLNVARLDNDPGGDGWVNAKFAFQAGEQNPTLDDFLILTARLDGTPYVEYLEVVDVPVVLGAWMPIILDGEADAFSKTGARFMGSVDYNVGIVGLVDANGVAVPYADVTSALELDYTVE